MARKDVDLVIRAKDEAAKVVDQITKALNEFSEGTKKLDQGAEKSENALTSLGAALGKLERALEGSAGTDKLAANLDRAGSSLARLEARLESTEQTAKDQGRALSRASSETERYTGKLNGATQALERQKGAVTAAKKDQTDLAAAQTKAATAVAQLTAKQAKLPAQINKQSAALDKAKVRYEELSAIIAGTAAPSATLQEQFRKSGERVTTLAGRLNKLQTDLVSTNSQLRAASSAFTIFSGQSSQAAANLARQQAILGKIETNYASLRAQVSASAGVQTKLQSELNKTGAALARQRDEVSKAESEYVDLAQSAGQADAAINKFADSSLRQLSVELRNQRKSTLEASQAWKLAQSNVKELAAAIDKARRPSKELEAAFAAAQARARTAKQEYTLNAQALNRMGQAYQSAGRSVQSLQTASGRVAAQQQRLAAELSRVSQQSRQAAAGLSTADAAARRHAGTVSRLAAAYREFYGDTRRSLGLFQRIRGEVLSLVAAYGGLYAGIEVIRGAVQATETLAGVSSRLNVAFGGNEDKAAKELEFIRREADRLGVAFTDLAVEYSKFAVATKGTNLAGEATRKIFINVAEAARVNRASQSELQGVFTALTQIVSKGAVQMEELRQQLGDRLPGAIQIMADALGVTTAELIKMMEQGQVTSDALLPFAEELSSRFSVGLPQALASITASLGRLKNAAFDALLIFSEGGFNDGFQTFIDTLTRVLNSADFEAFATRAGAAMGKFFEFLAVGAENFDLLLAAGAAFIGLRLAPILIAVAGGARTMATGITASAVAMRTGTGAAAGMATAVGGLRVALVALLSSTGIGLLVAAVGAGLALWATNADSATEALNTHRGIVDQVKSAYDAAGGSVEQWKKNLENLTASEARANLMRIEGVVQSLQDRMEMLAQGNNSFWTNFFGYNLAAKQEIFNVSDRYLADVEQVFQSFQDGALAADQLLPSLDAVNERYQNGSGEVTRFAEANIGLARDMLEADQAMQDAKDIVEALTDENGKAEESLDRLGDAAEEAGDDLDDSKENAEKFNEAMQKMGELIPEVKKEMEFQAAVAELEAVFAAALKAASGIDEMAAAAKRFEAAKAALNTSGLNAGNFEAQFVARAAAGAGSRDEELVRGVTALAHQMGLAAEDLLTVISYETAGTLSPSIANDGGYTGLIQFSPYNQKKYGVNAGSSVTEQVVAAGRYLEDAGVKAGDGLLRIYAAINAGSPDKIYASDENNGGAPGTVLDKVNDQMDGHRARAQGLLAAYGGVVKESEELVRTNERNAELAERQQQSTDKRIADTEFELEQQRRKNAGLDAEAAVQAAIRQAKADDPNITAEELAVIEQQVRATAELAQAKKGAAAATREQKKEEQAAMQLVQQLQQQRDELEKQRQLAVENGDTAKAQELKTEIEAVNAQLLQAIDNAIAMWEAVGGSAADAAIAKLTTAKLEAQNFGQEAQKNYLQWDRVGDLFVNGLTNAFDQFAQAVANGEDVGEAARRAFLQFASDFLREIATMIIKQAIFNALRAAFGGTPFGSLIGIGAAHTGGLVGGSRAGSGNATRQVHPSVFAGALRYHTGGIAGLAPNEVPLIAKRGEEILTEDDPRHMLNGAGQQKGTGQSTGKQQTIVNAFDSPSFLESALASAGGTEILMNFVKANRDSFVSVLEG